jgi:hypothetical protein
MIVLDLNVLSEPLKAEGDASVTAGQAGRWSGLGAMRLGRRRLVFVDQKLPDDYNVVQGSLRRRLVGSRGSDQLLWFAPTRRRMARGAAKA